MSSCSRRTIDTMPIDVHGESSDSCYACDDDDSYSVESLVHVCMYVYLSFYLFSCALRCAMSY